jgi:CBS domain-containing protein
MKLKVSDVLDFINANADLKKRVSDIYVAVTLDQSVASAYDILMEKGLYLGIISNEKGEPIQFITTGDVRRVLVPIA